MKATEEQKQNMRKYYLLHKHKCITCKNLVQAKSIKCRSCQKLSDKNPQWKGENVGYGCLHAWVRRRKPKPEFCEACGKRKPHDLANISGEYHRDIRDYEWLCRKCHMEDDNRLIKLKKCDKRKKYHV